MKFMYGRHGKVRRDGNGVMKTFIDILAGLLRGKAKYPFPIKSLNKLFIFIIYTHLSKLLKRSTEAIPSNTQCMYAYSMF